MGLDVTVCVGTYGDDEWQLLAQQRAVASALQVADRVIHRHADTLQNARNGALEEVTTEHVCYLDADDELETGYFDHMNESTADLRAPSVRYVRNGRPQRPRMPRVVGHDHACTGECLPYGNWLVIGTVARTDIVRNVGGFHDFPCYEDWDLWVRCYFAGATIEAIPDAVYRAHVRKDSRNRAPSDAARLETHREIARANSVPVP